MSSTKAKSTVPNAAPWRLLVEISGRFLRGRGSRLLSGSARAALIATALGVFAMVIAMSLMSGYRRDLREKIVGGSASLIVYPMFATTIGPEDPAIETLRSLPGVSAVEPVVLAQGSLSSAAQLEGLEVTVRGVELDDGTLRFNPRLGATPHAYTALEEMDGRMASVLLGKDLARRLSVKVGDSLRLTVLGLGTSRPKFSFRTVRVLGEFETGFSQFDRNWMVMERSVVSELIGGDKVSGLLEVSVASGHTSADVLSAADRALGEDYLAIDSNSQNEELFAALRWQQTLLFLVLGLIVLVSMFNVAATLIVLVRERLREIGVLSAMGLAPGRLRWIFLLYALGLTTVGTALGLGLGSAVAFLLDRFRVIRFDSEVAAIYFIDSVSFDLRPVDLMSIVAFTLLTSVAACWIPASRAARIDPSSALRHE